MAGYGSDDDFAAYLAASGLAVPTGPGALTPAILRQRGSDYIDATYEPMLQCSQREGGFSQERAWPRTGHVANGQAVSGIPQTWVLASYRAAWLEGNNIGWASGTINPNRVVKRQKVGDIEREFFGPGEVAETGAAGAMGNVDDKIHGAVSQLFCVARSSRFVVI